MKTTQTNIVHSSQVVSETGALSLGVLPLDLGMSQLVNADKNTVILADGRLVKLTGTDEDIQLIAADRNMRVKQTLIHLYLSGLNLAITRDYFVEAYGSPKAFWDKMTELTGFSRGKLENEIRISQGFTAEEIKTLAEAGATQSTAVRLLKASPAKKEEVVAQAEQGRLITPAVASEIMEMNEENGNSEDEHQVQVNLTEKEFLAKYGSEIPLVELIEEKVSVNNGQVAPQACVDIPATVSYEEIVTEENYVSNIKLLEQRLQGLLNAIEIGRNKSFTVRGQAHREEQAIVLAEFYNIKLPNLRPEEGEPNWIAEARKLLPKGVAQKFTSLYLMALVDGYLGYIRNQPNKPQIYEVFPKYLKKDSEKACHDIFDVGFAQAKAEAGK